MKSSLGLSRSLNGIRTMDRVDYYLEFSLFLFVFFIGCPPSLISGFVKFLFTRPVMTSYLLLIVKLLQVP